MHHTIDHISQRTGSYQNHGNMQWQKTLLCRNFTVKECDRSQNTYRND